MTCGHCASCDGLGQADCLYVIKAGDYGLCMDGKWRHIGFAQNLKFFCNASSAAKEIENHHTSVRLEVVPLCC